MPQPQAPSVEEAKKDSLGNELPKYTKAEEHYAKQMKTLLAAMQSDRAQKRIQFDDLTFDEYDDRCIKADLSYIPPAKNKGDTRIVTGMTREKDSTLLSTALSYDFEPNLTAYDLSDRIIDEIGENMEDLIFKSRQIENYDAKRPLLYRGIISRGTYYAIELAVEKYGYEKVLPEGYVKGTVSGVEWTERLKKVFEGCEVNGLDPKSVYLSSYREFFIQNQDAVAIVDRMQYGAARDMFSTWERWKYVPKQFTSTGVTAESTALDNIFNPFWTMTSINQGEVERIIIMKRGTNELQIFLNGVMMLPVVSLGEDKEGNPIVSGFPLTSISPSGDYPIAKGDFEPIEGFAISKGQPAKMRVDQEVQDEFLKIMILKTKKSFDPPMGNTSGRILTRQNLMPSVINDDIPKGSVFPLYDQAIQGVTAGEFSFYQLIKGQMEEKSTTKQYEGSENANMTATQVLENKKQQLLKLGLALDGIKRFEHDLAMLRLRNILALYTKAQDAKIDETRGAINEIFKTFTIEKTKHGRRQRSRKIIKFTKNVDKLKEEDPKGYMIHEEEEKAQKESGIDTSYVFINPEALRNLKAKWYCTIVPSDKKDDALSRMMFIENIKNAIEIFGPESINVEKLKQRYSAVIGEDYETWFRDEGTLNELMASAGAQPGMETPNTKPSLKMTLGTRA